MTAYAVSPILLLVGEGNFSFAYHLMKNKTYPEHIIIATDLTDYTPSNPKYISELKQMPEFNKTFFIKFGVDVIKLSLQWKTIFHELKLPGYYRPPNIIQFNFPWNFSEYSDTKYLIRSLFEQSNIILDSSTGVIKLSLLGQENIWYGMYEIEKNIQMIPNLECLSSCDFQIKYKGFELYTGGGHVDLKGSTEKTFAFKKENRFGLI